MAACAEGGVFVKIQIIGYSGSGKSTLARKLADFIRAFSRQLFLKRQIVFVNPVHNLRQPDQRNGEMIERDDDDQHQADEQRR